MRSIAENACSLDGVQIDGDHLKPKRDLWTQIACSGSGKHHAPIVLHVDHAPALFLGKRHYLVGVAIVLVFAFAIRVMQKEREPPVEGRVLQHLKVAV